MRFARVVLVVVLSLPGLVLRRHRPRARDWREAMRGKSRAPTTPAGSGAP